MQRNFCDVCGAEYDGPRRFAKGIKAINGEWIYLRITPQWKLGDPDVCRDCIKKAISVEECND